jgi:ribosomal protein S18 acetylase RimI-like enzyme
MPSAGSGSVMVRALRADDRSAALALLRPAIAGSAYGAGARSALVALLEGTDPETRACVAVDDGKLVGIIVYGGIAGSVGAARVQLVVIDPDARMRGIATRLVEGAMALLASDGMRFVIVELPDDPALDPALRLLLRCRFRVEATVADFFRDGVNLAILRRELGGD